MFLRRLRPLVCAALLALSLTAPTIALATDRPGPEKDPKLQQVVAANEPEDLQTSVEITHGHIDLAPQIRAGKWEFLARDDSVSPSTWRDPAKMVFRFGQSSEETIPASNEYRFIGAQSGAKVWVVPQVEKSGVPWLGWSTQAPSVVAAVNGGVTITFQGHQGPGQVSVFSQDGNFSAPQVLWSTLDETSAKINVDVNTHTHVNWVFTEPGVHLIRMAFSATLNDGQEVSQSKVLRFAVGDETDAAAALAAQWQGSEGAGNGQGASADTTKESAPRPAPAADAIANAQSTETDSSTALVFLLAGGLIVGAALVIGLALVLTRKNRRAQEEALSSLRETPGV